MSKAQILVVEDERIVAEDIQKSLKNLGYAVSAVVSSGEEATKKAEEYNPDLVLMDIVLEGEMNGIEAANEIRSRLNIPIVYLTAYADEKTLERAKITEPFGYIIKPFEDRELLTSVEMALYKHKMEKKLRESQEWLSTTLSSIGDAVIATDAKGCVTFMNPVAQSLTGWKEEDAAGRPLRDVFNIVNEQTHEPVQDPVERVLREGVVVGLANHTVLIAKDGTETLIDDSGAPIRYDKGDVGGVVLVFRDTSDRKRLEAQLQQAQKMEAIGTLAGGIAHDFNNLLMGIQGRISLILLGIDSAHLHFEHLKGIEDLIQRGADLTKQLLGFARSGKYEVRPTDLNEIIEKSSEMFGRTKKEITIYGKYQKDIWIVEVDSGQIHQVLLNLYVNAWQAMPGGGELYLQTENVTLDENFTRPFMVELGKYVKISVADTGLGMDEETQRRIFEPFFTTKEMGRGTGLGLASAYGIIKNHGGIIDVYSEKGKGTTFDIYLPASEKAITIPEKKLSDEILNGTETVLFVDDEDIIIDVGRDMLRAMGYQVLLARNSKEAIDVYKKNKNRIDMVILDMIMPDMSGGEVYDRMKEINPNVKVLLSSGYSIDSEATGILKRGCNDFIQKPFTMKELSDRIRKILDKR